MSGLTKLPEPQVITPDGRRVFELHDKQAEFTEAVLSGQYRYLLYGGAIRGGKGLALDTPLPTPSGWTTMGEVRVGDVLLGADGLPTVVTYTSPIHLRQCYRVTFDDGASVVADDVHLWQTLTQVERNKKARHDELWRAKRRASRSMRSTGKRPDLVLRNKSTVSAKPFKLPDARSTQELLTTLHEKHSIDLAPSLALPELPLLVDPYVLGVWLGDGTSRAGTLTMSLEDFAEVSSHIRLAGFSVRTRMNKERTPTHAVYGLAPKLRTIGVFGNKHIPANYLRASHEQRLSLLQGIVDTDGHVGARGSVEITLCDERLVLGVQELCRTLGIHANAVPSEARLNGRVTGIRWRMKFTTALPVARLTRKAKRLRKPRIDSLRRYIVSITEVPTVPTKCIQVERSMFLCGREMTPTHNTAVVLMTLFLLCRVYPRSRWAIVRKDLPTLKRNTITSFKKLKPTPFVGELNQSHWTVKCANGSEIIFFPEAVRTDPDYDRWKGLEVNGFVLEEANELHEKTFYKAIERAGSWVCDGEQPLPLIMMTCNPAHNWVKHLFYDRWRNKALPPQFFYLPAKMSDNPSNPPEYIESLKNLREAERKRFVDGDWNSSDEPDQLIKFEWILNAMQNVEHELGANILGVDVARYGDDQSVLARRNGNALLSLSYLPQQGTDRTAAHVQTIITDPTNPTAADNVRVDVVGLGAGVVDHLASKSIRVVEVQSGGSAKTRHLKDNDATSAYRFRNLRSQMWWEFSRALERGEVCIDFEDSRLIEDLTAPRYSIEGNVIIVESKDDIKKRIGRSTDAGDAAVYAFANLQDEYSNFAGIVIPGQDVANYWRL